MKWVSENVERPGVADSCESPVISRKGAVRFDFFSNLYVEKKFPLEVAELKALSRLVDNTNAAVLVARGELQRASGLAPTEFEAIASPIEAANW